MKRWIIIAIVLVLIIAGSIIWYTMSKSHDQNTNSSVTDITDNSDSSISQSVSQEVSSFQIISQEKAKQMIDSGNVIIVDVRRQDEYDAGHIPGAILIPNESINDTAPKDLPDKDAVLLIYCRTGIRAKDTSQKLSDLGYTQVYDIGGIVDWTYETER